MIQLTFDFDGAITLLRPQNPYWEQRQYDKTFPELCGVSAREWAEDACRTPVHPVLGPSLAQVLDEGDPDETEADDWTAGRDVVRGLDD